MAGHRPYRDEEVLEQLERILASSPFRNSRRASAMLRYTVERTLAGETDALKERTIGVEVFGRTPGYDTAADHIVRSTAGDVRRRLAQYYLENADAGGVRIDFAPGSYVPHFGDGGSFSRSAEPSLCRFWAPLLLSGRPVLLCMGGSGLAPVLGASTPARSKDQLTLGGVFQLESEKVAFSDAVTLSKVAGFLASRGAAYRIAHESDVDLDDLRQGPAVLIGALNNDWGLRLSEQFRFTFDFDAETLTCSILDRGAPAWSIGLDIPFTAVREDRGVVTRVMNQTTGQPMVLAAGVTMLGTLAAGELLTRAEYMPEGEWDRPNVQMLFATTVLRGAAAPPRVLETWFW
jgi:hypothetical protein